MESEVIVVKRKILGVLMRAARERTRRTIGEVAQCLGVTPARVRQYEAAARAITLPELEALSLFLQTPLSFFLDGKAEIVAEKTISLNADESHARRAAIGAKLKQLREVEGKSKDDCAQAIGCTAAMYNRYERGAADIPVADLDTLARWLGVNLFYFVADKTTADESSSVLELEKLSRLPRDVRAFVLDAGNLPYVRMAMKFTEMPADRLKELGEILTRV